VTTLSLVIFVGLLHLYKNAFCNTLFCQSDEHIMADPTLHILRLPSPELFLKPISSSPSLIGSIKANNFNSKVRSNKMHNEKEVPGSSARPSSPVRPVRPWPYQ